MSTVTRYGVHWAPGAIAFVHQQRGGSNAIGLREPSPFRVRVPRNKLCNHQIALNATNPAREHLAAFRRLLEEDSLMRFMLPLPKDVDPDHTGGVGTISVENVRAELVRLTLLAKLSSPIRMPVMWMNLTTVHAIMEELQLTDVQPLILLGVEAEHSKAIRQIIDAASIDAPRRLLIVAKTDVPVPAHELTHGCMTAMNLADLTLLPWEAFGACVLRAYMRREWEGAWFSREPVPANEMKTRHEPTAAKALPD